MENPNKPESQLGPKLSTPPNNNTDDDPSILVETIIKEEMEDDEVIELEEFPFVNKKGGVSVFAEEELMGTQTPPFLKKTYEMVENKESDEIISWGENGVTFVVWDYIKFSIDLLPKYFKHTNFSSFVRQLNTYGFRKAHFDRWEFANADFQRGKKQLLKSIKRKHHGSNNNSNSRLNSQRDSEIEKLKLEHEALKLEIHNLKQQQLTSNQTSVTLEDRVKSLEWKQKEFLIFISKAMKRTSLLHQLQQKCTKNNAPENGQVFKRRRLDLADNPDSSNFNPGYNPCLGNQVGQEQCCELLSGNYIMWEKLMEDDVICEDDNEEVFNYDDQTDFVHELQDLISKPFANVSEVACPGALLKA